MHDLGRALGDLGISEIGPLRLRLRCSDTPAVGAQADIKRGHRECAAATSSRLAYRRLHAHELRQLGDVGGDATGLFPGQPVGRRGGATQQDVGNRGHKRKCATCA